VGDFYSPNASQEIFKKIGNIGIVPLFFETANFCKKCNHVTDRCVHDDADKIAISGTKARTCLLNGEEIPDYLMRKDIIEILKDIYKNQKDLLFEKGQ